MLSLFANISFAMIRSRCFKFDVCFRTFCYTPLTQLFSKNRNESVTCGTFGTQIKKPNFGQQKKNSSVETLYGAECPNFSNTSHGHSNYQIAKIRRAPKLDGTFKSSLCYEEIPGSQALREHKITQHDFRVQTVNVDPDHVFTEVESSTCILSLRGRDSR